MFISCHDTHGDDKKTNKQTNKKPFFSSSYYSLTDAYMSRTAKRKENIKKKSLKCQMMKNEEKWTM